MTADETRARVLELLRPDAHEELPVCDSREALRNALVARGWVAVLDGRDGATAVRDAVRGLVAARGVVADLTSSFYDEGRHGALDQEAALRLFGEGLAQHGLGLVRPEDFEIAICTLGDAPEAAARLDALGAAEDGAALFPAALRHDATGLIAEARAARSEGARGGDAARRARLVALLAPGESVLPKTNGALRDLLEESGWAVEYRPDARTTLYTWDVIDGLRSIVAKHGASPEEVCAFYVADEHDAKTNEAFLSVCGRGLSAYGLAVLRVGGRLLAACAFEHREEAVALLERLGLAKGDGALFPAVPRTPTETRRPTPTRLVHERFVVPGTPPAMDTKSHEDSVFVETSDGSIDLLRLDVWPPTFRGESFPADAHELRAFSDARRTMVRRAGSYPSFTRTGFVRRRPSDPWCACGTLVGDLEYLGEDPMTVVKCGELHETRVLRDGQWQPLPIPPSLRRRALLPCRWS